MFGKHRGKELSQVPLSYLKWLATTEIKSRMLKAGISQELRERAARGSGERQASAKPSQANAEPEQASARTLAVKIIQSGKEIALRMGESPEEGDGVREILTSRDLATN